MVACSLVLFLSAAVIGTNVAWSREFGSLDRIAAGDHNGPAAICVLGLDTGSGNLLGMLDPGDAHYLLIDPSQCEACNGHIVVRRYVFTLNSDAQAVGCTITLRATIIGATGTPACLTPDPSITLCAPKTETIINPPAPLNTQFDAIIDAPENCCLNGPAFLKIEVLAVDDCARLGLTLAGPCTLCQTYWYDSSSDTLHDTCVTFGGFRTNLHVDADCCVPVPVAPRTWGNVKTLFQ
jgi:hypothetical protein